MIFHLSALSYIGFSDTPDAASIRTLINQQKTLQQSVSLLEKVALKISAEKEKGQRKQVPRDLTVSVKLHSVYFYSVFIRTKATVRDAYKQISEDDGQWNLSVWFVMCGFYKLMTCYDL